MRSDAFYNIYDWYWVVGDHTPANEVYSTAAAAYVPDDAAAYVAWLAKGDIPTVIPQEAELIEHLKERYEEGLPMMVRLRGIRPQDMIHFLRSQNKLSEFITAIGGSNSADLLEHVILAERINVIDPGPVRTALVTAGLTLQNVTLAVKKLKWSNQ